MRQWTRRNVTETPQIGYRQFWADKWMLGSQVLCKSSNYSYPLSNLSFSIFLVLRQCFSLNMEFTDSERRGSGSCRNLLFPLSQPSITVIHCHARLSYSCWVSALKSPCLFNNHLIYWAVFPSVWFLFLTLLRLFFKTPLKDPAFPPCSCPCLFLSCMCTVAHCLKEEGQETTSSCCTPPFCLFVMALPALTSLPAPGRSLPLFRGCACQLGMVLYWVLHCYVIVWSEMDGWPRLMLWL